MNLKYLVTSFDITCENPFPSQRPTHFKEYTCILSFTLKSNKDAAVFNETPYLVFNKLEQTKGKIPIPQLKCVDDSSDDFCTNSTVNQANCTNNYVNTIYLYPNWYCKFRGINPGFHIIKYNINYETPDGSKMEDRPRFYKKETCSLEYTLLKIEEPDKKGDKKSPENDKSSDSSLLCLDVSIFVICIYFSFFRHSNALNDFLKL